MLSSPRTESERKDVFYLTTFSAHFYLRLYGVGYMVNDLSDSERGNPLPPLHGLLFLINSKGSFMHHPTDRISYTTAFLTPVMEHWLERVMAQWIHHEGSIRRPIAPRANARSDHGPTSRSMYF